MKQLSAIVDGDPNFHGLLVRVLLQLETALLFVCLTAPSLGQMAEVFDSGLRQGLGTVPTNRTAHTTLGDDLYLSNLSGSGYKAKVTGPSRMDDSESQKGILGPGVITMTRKTSFKSMCGDNGGEWA